MLVQTTGHKSLEVKLKFSVKPSTAEWNESNITCKPCREKGNFQHARALSWASSPSVHNP